MKKRILIVNKTFETGGIQATMVSMANILCEYYDVDLFLYYPSGTMRSRVSPKVNILTPDWHMNILGMTWKDVVKTKKPKYILCKIIGNAWAKCFGNKIPIAYAFKHQKKLTGYDLAIAYHHEQRSHTLTSGFVKFVNTRVDAKKKVAWFHFDTSHFDMDFQSSMADYMKMDKIFCVTKSNSEKAKEVFPQLSEKIDYCYNFLDTESVINMSRAELPFAIDEDKFVCFSACRLSKEKALIRAVNCLAPALKANPDVIWYIAGDGIEYENIKAEIIKNHVEAQIKLIGNQTNPYPMMRRANLIMSLSYNESVPMVILESLLLGVPVFATETISTHELSAYGSMFYVCKNNEEGITQSFADLLSQKNKLRENKSASLYCLNDASLKKIMALISSES